MRTQEEIVARMQGKKTMFGFETSVLVDYLEWQHAQQFLKDDVTKEGWAEEPDHPPASQQDFGSLPRQHGTMQQPDKEPVMAAMADYLRFAWGKAMDERGLSAMRSIEKLGAWLWLLEDEEAVAVFAAADYDDYGIPKLRALSEYFKLPIPEGC